ncbi:hypothetical protein [Pseudonocardia asaccharolytica]|nr:hypothetical protein [Pseudonocardia asaccharolytica]
MLAQEPAMMWKLRAEQDKTYDQLHDTEGALVPYAELEARAGERFSSDIVPEIWNERYARAQASIERLSADLRALDLDLVIIVGDDQEELFDFSNLPAISVFYGEMMTMEDPDADNHGRPIPAEIQRRLGNDGAVYRADAAAGRFLIESLIEQEFDVASTNAEPTGTGFGHAYGWVLGRLLSGADIPAVPIMLNTYFPPNQPTAARCYELGQALRKAVESLPGQRRVGVVASGGLSHFVVDHDLDQRVLEAMRAHDAAFLRSIPQRKLRSGTSEIRNWVTVAGASEHLTARWIDYIPAVRTLGGTGIGLAFGLWS